MENTKMNLLELPDTSHCPTRNTRTARHTFATGSARSGSEAEAAEVALEEAEKAAAAAECECECGCDPEPEPEPESEPESEPELSQEVEPEQEQERQQVVESGHGGHIPWDLIETTANHHHPV